MGAVFDSLSAYEKSQATAASSASTAVTQHASRNQTTESNKEMVSSHTAATHSAGSSTLTATSPRLVVVPSATVLRECYRRELGKTHLDLAKRTVDFVTDEKPNPLYFVDGKRVIRSLPSPPLESCCSSPTSSVLKQEAELATAHYEDSLNGAPLPMRTALKINQKIHQDAIYKAANFLALVSARA